MPISVQCQCGQSLKAPDNLAGKRVKCPKCSQVIQVPAAGSGSAGSGSAGGGASPARSGACPQCGAEMQTGAVICVACGFHTKTGKVLQSHGVHKVAKTKAEQQIELRKMTETERMLAKAEAELGDGPLLSDENYGSSAGNWGLMFGCIAMTVLIIGVSIAFFNFREAARTNYDPSDKRSQGERQAEVQRRIVGPVLSASLLTVMGVGGVMGLGGWFAIVRNAGKANQMHGSMCLLGGPPYAVVYGFTNPDKNKTWAAVCGGGFLLVAVAAGVWAIMQSQGVFG